MAATLVASPMPRRHLDALSLARSFWYDGDETQSPSCGADATVCLEWLPAFKFGELGASWSEDSTSAGSTPSIEHTLSPLTSKSPPPSPEIEHRTDLAKNFDTPPSTPLEVAPTSIDKAKWAQVRKIFVGGIPQSMDQNSLYKLFSKAGKVKKAWLQMFHADSPEGQGSIKKHRGFGFVIFAEKEAVDQLLGDDFSKVIHFGDGIRLELKRAVGKTGTSPLTPEVMPKTPGLVKQERCETPLLALDLSTALQDEPLQISLATVFKDLPNVPHFPCAQSPQVPWQCQTTLAVAIPVQQVKLHHQLNLNDSICTRAQHFLLDGYIGRKPQSLQELEMVLRQAMPDCYEE